MNAVTPTSDFEENIIPAKRAAKPDGKRFKVEYRRDIAPPTGDLWLLKGILPKVGVGTLFGQSGAYKSFAALDIAQHIAAGKAWGGRRISQAQVVCIAAEGAGGVRKRLAGANMRHPEDACTPLCMIGASVNLGTENGDAEALAQSIEAEHIKPGLIVVDTLSASLGAAEENGTGMTAFIGNCQRLSEQFEAFVLAVHHVGHGENAGRRERGNSALIGNVDTRIFCEKGERLQTTLECVKVKDGPEGLAFRLELEVVHLGKDSDGDAITTLAVKSVEPVEIDAKKAAKKVSVPPQERLLIDMVQQAIIDVGKIVQPFPGGPKVKAVTDDDIRPRYYKRLAEKADLTVGETPEKHAESQSKAFRRSINNALKGKRLLAADMEGTRVIWLPS